MASSDARPAGDDPVEMFYLPVGAIKFYDDPYSGVGDDGYDVAGLKAEVIRDGGILQPIAVGKSRHDVEHRADHAVCSFNGNHRMAVAMELGLAEMLCENSEADDALPLSRAEIEALGGRLFPGPGLAPNVEDEPAYETGPRW